jgi:hypothetical protein
MRSRLRRVPSALQSARRERSATSDARAESSGCSPPWRPLTRRGPSSRDGDGALRHSDWRHRHPSAYPKYLLLFVCVSAQGAPTSSTHVTARSIRRPKARTPSTPQTASPGVLNARIGVLGVLYLEVPAEHPKTTHVLRVPRESTRRTRGTRGTLPSDCLAVISIWYDLASAASRRTIAAAVT